MPGTVDWLPGLVVLAVGLVGGVFLVRRFAPSPAAARPRDTRALALRDLETRRDVLVDQLRELDDEAGDPADRRRLEREAATVLRDIDRLHRAPAPAVKKGAAAPEPAAEPARPDRAALKGFLWGTGSAAAVALLLFLVSRSATEREAGGSLTGEVPGATGAPAGVDEEMAQLEAVVQRNPDDVEARMALARAALGRQEMMVVFEQTRAVLEKQPRHARALSYQALVRLAMGQADTAETMLRQAQESDPDLLEGYVHMSLVHLRQGKAEAAQADIEEAARRHPSHAPRLRALWAEMQAQAEAEPEGQASGADHPPAAAAGPAVRPGAPAGGGVAGTVELADGLSAPPGAIVFITLRAAGVTSGPPVAAKRLPAASFPLRFDVGPSDSMMGQTLPDRLRVDARVDRDGDPLTRDPADPTASADDVRLGDAGLRLILRKGA
jgi:cytochrome c-type biogenesis protein CcmH